MATHRLLAACLVGVSVGLAPTPAAEPLPDTKPLTDDGDLAAKMVAGMHKYLDAELSRVFSTRGDDPLALDHSTPEALGRTLRPHQDRLRKMLGATDPRLPPRLEYVTGPDDPAAVAETDRYTIHAVRWAVLPGVDAEGLLLEPKGPPVAAVVAVPDADRTPEQVAGLAPGVPAESQFARRLAESGCRVLVPTPIDRRDELSANPRLNRATNQPHREFVHRMAYEMGRTLPGYEVQKVLAGIDWLCRTPDHPRIGLYGAGEGGLIVLYAAALDRRVSVTAVVGYGEPREHRREGGQIRQPAEAAYWQDPIDRNVWGRVRAFGLRELVTMADAEPRGPLDGPNARYLMLGHHDWPAFDGPPAPRAGRSGAAPGRLPRLKPGFHAEWVGNLRVRGGGQGGFTVEKVFESDNPAKTLENFAHCLFKKDPLPSAAPAADRRTGFDPATRQKRQFDQLVAFTQKLWRNSEAVRKEFWKKADASSPEAWEKSCDWYRDYFHSEVIGKLPEPTIPLNPRTRRVYDEPKWTGYEVTLDVYPDVFAYGILLLPKDLKPGERRPVVVCQHGLEGTPRHTIDVEKRTVYNHFSRRLVEQGYIVYAPQNPYYGENTFRQLQRKANPLKLSIFSFIIRQHQQTLDWLESLPNVDPKRIAFYGLSYGGKTAMRVPAVEKRYSLSICSGDFNEWVGKNVSVDLDRSYMWTREYEMYEFDLGNTFNYAEMAYLIAPRPFMVERGHDDGVGTDEMVAYEYARVRYLYANRLKIGDRTEIEFFPGGHMIHGKGTFAFLAKHLK